MLDRTAACIQYEYDKSTNYYNANARQVPQFIECKSKCPE